MATASGRSFGPYEIVAPIGEGGMGEVFKARDTRLDRLVAIKVAKDKFGDRFMKEAHAIAALNHPHIATLYDIGTDYLVMEYVEGETLPAPLPAARALEYARQILDALEAAHRKGIVHRDLKPANILIAKAGVKLLDFGLAQVKRSGPLGDASATMAMTLDATIAGTLHYMAPEQLQGKPADARTDIFAFGLVLYEMLTGRRAFDADTAASLITAIMSAEPRPLHDLQPVTPPALERIVERCLEKDSDQRWQSAFDVRCALDLVAYPTPAAAPAPVRRSRWRWIAAGVLLASLAGVAALRLAGTRDAEPWTFRPLTYSGRSYDPALSPDGKQVAYKWSGEKDDSWALYVQLVGGGNPLRLAVVDVIGKPAWSPDGSQVGFCRADGLYTIPALGGAARRIAAFRSETSGVAWSPDGAVFVMGGPHFNAAKGNLNLGLWSVPADGGDMRALTQSSPAADQFPSISPDGRTIAFVRRTSTYNSALMLLSLNRDGSASGTARQITSGVWDISSPAWTPDGASVVFEGSSGSGNSSLWRVPVKGGKPLRVGVPSMVAGNPALSSDSSRLVYVNGQFETAVHRMSLDGAAPKPQALVEGFGDHRDLGVSPDGSRIAFSSNRTGSKELWTANADGSNQTQLTNFGGPSVGSPRWSPDGKQIAFDGSASGSSDVYIISAEGGKPVHVTTDSGNEIRPTWSRDGEWIYFSWQKADGQYIWKMRRSGGQPVQISRTPGFAAFETPDGEWLYVLGNLRLFRMRPDGTDETLIRGNTLVNFFAMGGRHVYVLDPNTKILLRSPFGTNAFDTVHRFDDTSTPHSGGTCIGVPSDESYLLYRRNTRTLTNLVLIENFR